MNNYNGKNNRKGGNTNRRNNNFGRKDNSEFLAKKKEMLEKQTKNIEMIESASQFLDYTIKESTESTRIMMTSVLDFLKDKGFTQDETKAISQFNYLLMDLANAQLNKYITGNRINIRILYIQERLKTSFRKDFYDRIDEMFGAYPDLYKWNEASESESIEFSPSTTEETASNELVKEDSTSTES